MEYTFSRASLEANRTLTKKMYLMNIVNCSDPRAKQETHAKANPYVARVLRREFAKFVSALPGSDPTTARLDTDALEDADFATVYRGTELGFAIVSPEIIFEGMKVAKPTINLTSDSGIVYRLRFAEYTGKGIMKTRKEVDIHQAFGFAEIPPTALMHPNINTEDAMKDSFNNALIGATLKPHTIEFKKDAAGNRSNELVIKWTTTLESERNHFYKAYKVTLPSGDEGSITFSGEFCEKFNLHKRCGRPRPPCDERWGPAVQRCPYCDAQKGNGKKKIQKRSFDDMFEGLNKE
jgi:hypothetical protein